MEDGESDFYERLRIEIVKSAVKDLKKAIKKSKRLGYICDEQKKLERWFRSKWGQALSGDNGELITEKCHANYNTQNYSNGKPQLPDDVQKQIYTEYIKGKRISEICRDYGISYDKLYNIVKRWEK